MKYLMSDFPAQGAIFGKIMVSALESRPMLYTTVYGRLKTAMIFASYFANPFRFLSRIDSRRTLGNALIGRLLLSLTERDVPLWLNTAAKELIYENNRIIGLVAEKDGQRVTINTRKGIIFAAGGFEKNQAMRDIYQRKPVSAEWSMGWLDNEGDAIKMGLDIGAGVSLMNEAWWMPMIMIPGKHMPWYIKNSWWETIAKDQGKHMPWFVLIERSLPHCIFVNQKGRRFTNEAVPYIDFVNNQIKAHNSGDSAVPAYMIICSRYHFKYPFGPIMPGFPVQKFEKCGLLTVGGTLEELADKCGIDRDGLIDEVKKNNAFAETGKDRDFNKGATSIERYYSDAAVKPNCCLGPIDRPPYYAIKVYPGDLGTKGGLETDAHARVLREDGSPIEGLYATGNCTSSVMGASYPGAGGTIGPSMVFGYIATKHIGKKQKN